MSLPGMKVIDIPVMRNNVKYLSFVKFETNNRCTRNVLRESNASEFIKNHHFLNLPCLILFFGPRIFIIEGRTDQRNAQINFSLINLLLFKSLRHVSATQLEPSSGSLKSLQVTSHCNLLGY